MPTRSDTLWILHNWIQDGHSSTVSWTLSFQPQTCELRTEGSGSPWQKGGAHSLISIQLLPNSPLGVWHKCKQCHQNSNEIDSSRESSHTLSSSYTTKGCAQVPPPVPQPFEKPAFSICLSYHFQKLVRPGKGLNDALEADWEPFCRQFYWSLRITSPRECFEVRPIYPWDRCSGSSLMPVTLRQTTIFIACICTEIHHILK